MNQIAHPAVIEAAKRLERLSTDKKTRRLADARELAMLTEALEIKAAEARGVAIGEERGVVRGVAIGEERGEARGLEKAVARLVANGMSETQARQALGLLQEATP